MELQQFSGVNSSPFQSGHKGWFKAIRSTDVLELIRRAPNAFTLAFIIAYRARYREGFNADGIEHGEAMLGDFAECGLSEREYRTAKKQLEKWEFATFRTTNRGTIGKLTDTRLFDPLNVSGDGQNDNQPTGERQAGDGQETTNKKDKKDKRENKANNEGPNNTAHRHLTSLEKEIMENLTTSLGNSEMVKLGGYWLDHWVRPHPQILKSGLDELNKRLVESGNGIAKPIVNKAAWLIERCKGLKKDLQRVNGSPNSGRIDRNAGTYNRYEGPGVSGREAKVWRTGSLPKIWDSGFPESIVCKVL